MASNERITKPKQVTLQYSLTTGNGAAIRAASSKPIHYVQGCGNLIPTLEGTLEGQRVGELVRVRLLPDDAFGRCETELMHEVPLDALPPGEDIATGNSLVGQDEQGNAINFRITTIEDDLVKLDANQPWQGEHSSSRFRFKLFDMQRNRDRAGASNRSSIPSRLMSQAETAKKQ